MFVREALQQNSRRLQCPELESEELSPLGCPCVLQGGMSGEVGEPSHHLLGHRADVRASLLPQWTHHPRLLSRQLQEFASPVLPSVPSLPGLSASLATSWGCP